MHPPGHESTGNAKPSIRIAEAARRLGVSERTIYRMLRSGKLTRADLSDVKLTDVSQMSDIKRLKFEIEEVLDKKAANLSDIVSDKLARHLDSELKARDAQIDRLIATQRELHDNIRRLQEQVFELACLVVKQHTETEQTATKADQPSQKAQIARLRDLFRVRKGM